MQKSTEEQSGSAAPPSLKKLANLIFFVIPPVFGSRYSAPTSARSTFVKVNRPVARAGIGSANAVALGGRNIRRQSLPDAGLRSVDVKQIALVGGVSKTLARPVSAAFRRPYVRTNALGAVRDLLGMLGVLAAVIHAAGIVAKELALVRQPPVAFIQIIFGAEFDLSSAEGAGGRIETAADACISVNLDEVAAGVIPAASCIAIG